MLLLHINDRKLRCKKNQRLGLRSVQCSKASACIPRHLHPAKNQISCPRSSSGVPVRAGNYTTEVQEAESSAHFGPALPEHHVFPSPHWFWTASWMLPASQEQIFSELGRAPQLAAASERSGLSLERSICSACEENKSGRKDPLGKALVPQVSLLGPQK